MRRESMLPSFARIRQIVTRGMAENLGQSTVGGGFFSPRSPLRPAMVAPMSNVLFVCVANSGRSVMAERLFRRAAGTGHQARSAGSNPGAAPHPVVLEALEEIGLDASDHVPRLLDAELVAWADVVVATCDDACPVSPGKRYTIFTPFGLNSAWRASAFSIQM